MRTVGQIFKEEREEKLLSLEDVEKSIKIRKELLVALESDDYSKLPPATFVQGFIKNYAQFLGLDSEKLLAIYRREFAVDKQKNYVMDAFAKPPKENKFKITPSRVIGFAVTLLVLVFFVYLWWQYRQFAGVPSIAVSQPVDQLTTTSATITVEGKTDPEMKVSVNSQDVQLNAEGIFKEEVALSSEINKIIITATSKYGQKSTVERTVYLKNSEE